MAVAFDVVIPGDLLQPFSRRVVPMPTPATVSLARTVISGAAQLAGNGGQKPPHEVVDTGGQSPWPDRAGC